MKREASEIARWIWLEHQILFEAQYNGGLHNAARLIELQSGFERNQLGTGFVRVARHSCLLFAVFVLGCKDGTNIGKNLSSTFGSLTAFKGVSRSKHSGLVRQVRNAIAHGDFSISDHSLEITLEPGISVEMSDQEFGELMGAVGKDLLNETHRVRKCNG